MSKIDNVFAKVISDEAICKEYGINDPQKYQNVAQGLKSLNGHVVAIATALQQIDKLRLFDVFNYIICFFYISNKKIAHCYFNIFFK